MRKIVSLFSLLLISACLSRTPDASFYGLQALAQEAPLSDRKISVGVNRAVIPSYLEKPQIVLVGSDGVELQVSEYHRWGESLASLLQRITADDLNLLLPRAEIKPQNFTAQIYDYYLTLEVNRMDGTWNKQAVLDVWWTVTDSRNKVLKRERTSLSAPLGKTYEDYAQVQSRLLGELSARIAAVLAKI